MAFVSAHANNATDVNSFERQLRMRMTIQYASGLRVEAILLAASRERMRIVVTGQRDASELTILDGCWYMDAREAITIEAFTTVEDIDSSQFCAGVYPRTLGAGDSPSL